MGEKNISKKIGKTRIISGTRFQSKSNDAKVGILMNEKWEKFNGRPFGNSASKEVRVTLNKNSYLQLNRHAYDALGQPAAVELFYEGNRRAIGVKPTDLCRTNAFPVRNSASRHKRICAAAFCHHYRIRLASTMLFQNVEMGRDGMMVLDLMNTVKVSRGAR